MGHYKTSLRPAILQFGLLDYLLEMEESEKAGADGRPSYWENKITTITRQLEQKENEPNIVEVTGLIYVIVRRFDRPGYYAEHGMEWLVYEDGRIDAQHKYPPC